MSLCSELLPHILQSAGSDGRLYGVLGVCICDFGKPHCITGVSSELIVRLYLLCAYLVVVPTAVPLPLEGLVVCIIYYLLLIYLLPSGAVRRHLYCLSLRTGRLLEQALSLNLRSSLNLYVQS